MEAHTAVRIFLSQLLKPIFVEISLCYSLQYNIDNTHLCISLSYMVALGPLFC